MNQGPARTGAPFLKSVSRVCPCLPAPNAGGALGVGRAAANVATKAITYRIRMEPPVTRKVERLAVTQLVRRMQSFCHEN